MRSHLSQRHYTKHLDRMTTPRQRYTGHLSRFTRVVRTNTHRRWLITELQFRLVVRTHSGRRTTLEKLAAEMGMTRGGLSNDIDSLITGGVLIRYTKRGRHGWTFLKARAGVGFLGFLENVASREERSKKYEVLRSLIGDISDGVRATTRQMTPTRALLQPGGLL